MSTHFDEFYELLKIDRKKSPFSSSQTLKSRYEKLQAEMEELKIAIDKNDSENLREELGDVLWDLLALTIIAEESGSFKADDLLKDSLAKLKRRKPWLFEDKQLTAEEELELWNRVKKKENELRKK
ncbi:MAG: DUF4088 family protein [archaeon]